MTRPGHSTALDLLEIDGLLTPEERMIRDTVRAFCAIELQPGIGGWFEQGVFPEHLAGRFGELGVLGMHLEGYGCAGVGAVAYGVACQELEAVDSGVRSFVSVQGSLAMGSLHRHGSEEHKQEWLLRMARGEAIGCFGLTEADHGSDPAHMRTVAVRDGADWLLNGSKMWITNGSIADVAVVWAQTEDGIRGFVVPTDTPGFTAREIPRKLSMRASVTAELSFDDLRLPADACLPGARGLGGPLSALNEARFGILFGVIGAARDCLQVTLDYALARTQFGRSIAGFQLTQSKLADMAVELAKAQLLALHLGRLREAGPLAPAAVSVGKLNNVREALQIARTCRTILAASGVTTDYSPLRHANNLESVLTYEGTSEVHALTIGRALTGLSAFA